MIPPRCYVCGLELFHVPDDDCNFTLIFFGKDGNAKMPRAALWPNSAATATPAAPSGSATSMSISPANTKTGTPTPRYRPSTL
ncbi:MAG: hypothetical protein ACM3ML_11110 [Micromonosporaceae bacterium]